MSLEVTGAARGGQAAARRTRHGRRLPGRRALPRAVAGAVLGPPRPTVGAGRHAAAAAVPETPLRVGLRDTVQGSQRLDLVAAVLPHSPGPAGAAPDHPGQAGPPGRPRGG